MPDSGAPERAAAPPTETVWLPDDPDAQVPNNQALPLVVYRAAISAGDADAEQRIEALFARNGWSNGWVNGIYPYHHYHATTHEVLGLARGSARVQFGGPSGPIVNVAAGDVVMIPAGVAHRRDWASSDLSVVGAYPGGGDYDLRRTSESEYRTALSLVHAVPPPTSDPVVGPGGPACHARRA
jgi:uncharacterized protein YjlB